MKWNKLLLLLALGSISISAFCQSLVMVKAYDQDMKPVSQMGISVDGAPYKSTDDNGALYLELHEGDLPPKTIRVDNEQYEAESWNYSKGVLEVLIRRKNYRLTTLLVRDSRGRPLPSVNVKLNTPEPVLRTADGTGKLQLPVPLNVNILTTSLLEVPFHVIRDRRISKDQVSLTVDPLQVAQTVQAQSPFERNFEQSDLDSIQSLTVFYGFIKNLDIQKLNEDLRARLDEKFYVLMSQQIDSLGLMAQSPIGRISDSSLVSEDISLLIQQAQQEELALAQLKSAFDEKIALISSKLVGGGANMDPQSRQELLSKLEELDGILTANSLYFSTTNSEYHQILTSMRNQLLNIKDLEQQLTDVQLERLAEQRAFRNRLLLAGAVLLGLAVITFVLLFLLRKIKRQKREIDLAHQDLNEVNEHLEELVQKRTELLKHANEELDIFMYRSSHDLRRPITSILGLVQIAKMTVKGEALELFERVASTARNMDRMLQKLIMVSHINQPSETATIRLESFPGKYEQHFSGLIDKHHINLDWQVEKDLRHHTCPVKLDIIVSNLLENALRFSARNEAHIKPRVLVKLYHERSDLVLEVEDNAGGIDARVQPKIWNMFYVGSEISKGNGLGLYITRRAVAKLDAEISFNCEGQQTTFKVLIPSGKVRHLNRPELVAV